MNKLGFSLIEVMIVTAIVSILGLGLSTMVSNLSHSQQSLSQKMTAIDTQNTLSSLIANPQQCNANFRQFQWPAGQPPSSVVIPAPGLQWYNTSTNQPSSTAIALGPQTNGYGLQVSSIQLKNLTSLGGGLYNGRLEVAFAGTTLALNPAKISNLVLSTTTTGGVETVQGCSSGAQQATVLGTVRLDTGATPKGFGRSGNPYGMDHIYCQPAYFTPGWTPAKVFITGSVQYSSVASAQPAHDHGYSFFAAGINAAAGNTTVCVDNNSGDARGVYSREIFTWTIWGMP